MKHTLTTLGALSLATLLLSGCGSSDAEKTAESTAPTTSASTTSKAPLASAVTVAYDKGSIKKGDKAHCAVCVAKEGSTEEETVAETLDYKDKTYAFCNESEKAEFISDPAKYAAK